MICYVTCVRSMNCTTIRIQITFPLLEHNIIHHDYGARICYLVRSKCFQYNLESKSLTYLEVIIVTQDYKENGMLEIIAVIRPATQVHLRDVKSRSYHSDKR